jgi:hypothetical protein
MALKMYKTNLYQILHHSKHFPHLFSITCKIAWVLVQGVGAMPYLFH